MTLSCERLKKRLARPFKYFDSLDSTNDEAKTWLLNGAPELSVVIADEQTRGRGRHGRIWHTPPGVALAVSIILRTPAGWLPRVNMIGALSVYDLAQQVGCSDIGIKWPNDVLLSGRKVSGILGESIWARGELRGVVLGIGVNVRMDFQGTELEKMAISLEDITGQPLDRSDLVAALAERVAYWNGRIDKDDVFSTWRRRLHTLNTRVAIGSLRGLALDVTADGELLIQDDFRTVRRVAAGELTHRHGER